MPLSGGAEANVEEIEERHHSEVEGQEQLKDQMKKKQKLPGAEGPADWQALVNEESQEKTHSQKMESDAGWDLDKKEEGAI